VETYLSELLDFKGEAVFGVPPETSVEDAAKTMSQKRIGALLVRRGDELLGILTERDILNKIVAQGLNAADVTVAEIMVKEVIVIDQHRTVRDAMQVVTEKKLRHLPVVKDGKLVGMLSGGDLTRSIVAAQEGYIDNLYEYINGHYPA
jgi:CBS domain-containing protein